MRMDTLPFLVRLGILIVYLGMLLKLSGLELMLHILPDGEHIEEWAQKGVAADFAHAGFSSRFAFIFLFSCPYWECVRVIDVEAHAAHCRG